MLTDGAYMSINVVHKKMFIRIFWELDLIIIFLRRVGYKMFVKTFILFPILVIFLDVECQVYNSSNWKYHFPSGSGMGIYAALAIGVPDSPNIDLFLAVFFEAYYSLPANETYFEFPPDVSKRAFGRRHLYESMEKKLELNGNPGKPCVMKTICEAASYSARHLNGLVGDLLYILLTPSSTQNPLEDELLDYKEAEEIGENSQNCAKYNACDVNLLDAMSFIK